MAKDYIGEQRDKVLRRIMQAASDRFREGADRLPSPIEQAFMFALLNESDDEVHDFSWLVGCGWTSFLLGGRVETIMPDPANGPGHVLNAVGDVVVDGGSGMALHIRPQCRIGRATVDFLLELHCGATVLLAVECDGHDFHEKTKEQARRDKARDRAIQAASVPIFRFAGSEIYADAGKCARTCLEFLRAEMARKEATYRRATVPAPAAEL